MQKRFCSESIVQPKSSLFFRNKELEEKNLENIRHRANVSVCLQDFVCDVGLDDSLSKASISYETVLPAVCREQLAKSRERRGVHPEGGVRLER